MSGYSISPTVVFFDAVGTLFRVRDSVGHIYSQAAAEFGVLAEADLINRAFFQAFKAAPPAAFPDASATELLVLEREWWRAVVERTFELCELRDRFSDFPSYFQVVFDRFATASTWELYEETLPVLRFLQSQQVTLGIISNFDSRLHAVLDVLGLRDYFQSVTLSTAVGAAKPDSHVFAVAARTHAIAPARALHVGDSHKQDYLGAKRAGMQALWLLRREPMLDEESVPHPPDADVISDLTGISARLELGRAAIA
ncbi:MAG: HAD-IA family hydrolase [Cyanobacteria bacterium J06642_2]